MPRSPLTETIKRVQGMVSYVQENLSADEYMLFLDMVDPQPEPEQTKVKRTRKKTATNGTSKRASGMAEAIKNSLERGRQSAASDALCVAQVPNLDVPCAEREDALIHDPNGGYSSYHPFLPPAQPAGKRSRQKGAGTGSTPNLEGAAASAAVAAGGSNE